MLPESNRSPISAIVREVDIPPGLRRRPFRFTDDVSFGQRNRPATLVIYVVVDQAWLTSAMDVLLYADPHGDQYI